MVASLLWAQLAGIGIAIGVILAAVAYFAFLKGMAALSEMGRLAKLQRLVLEAEHQRERARRLEEAQRKNNELRAAAAAQGSQPTSEANQGKAASTPWWRYEPRRRTSPPAS